MEKISSSGFQNILTRQEVLNGHEIIEDLAITDLHRHTYDLNFGRTIQNCIFKNCTFDGVDFSYYKFDKCKFNNLNIKLSGQKYTKINLINCEIKEFTIDSPVNNNTLEEVNISGEDTSIDNATIRGSARKINFTKLILFKECQLFLQSYPVDLGIINVESLNLTFFGICKNLKATEVKKSHILIQDNDSFGTADINHCYYSSFHFTNCNYKLIIFSKCKNTELSCFDLKATEVYLKDGSFSKVEMKGSCELNLNTPKNYALSLGSEQSDISISSFILMGLNLKEDSTIYLNKVKFDELKFIDFENEGNIHVRNSEITKTVDMISSNLKAIKFNNVTLGNDCKVNIMDVDLSDLVLDNFRWNNDYRIDDKFEVGKYDNEKNFLISQREAYRQLKSLYLKLGNKIESLEFQKHELRIHFKIVKLEKNNDRSWRNCGNFLILWTNKYSSDFGQNIWKPLLWLVLFHLVCVNMILWCTPNLNIGWEFQGWDALMRGVTFYFQTLLPVHSTDFRLSAKEIVSFGGFWDFAARIFSGYFIYYFISASRKYHQ